MSDRLLALRELLRAGQLSTQDELRRKLQKQHFAVNQSTISRDLRKLGAIRTADSEGRVVYRLPESEPRTAELDLVKNMVRSIEPASAMVVIHTAPGSASLVARHLDMHRPPGILGTIAGDDTVFLALSTKQMRSETLQEIEETLRRLR